MPSLCDSLQHKNFLKMLEQAEAAPLYMVTDWESKFISDLRDKYSERDAMIDLGVMPWSPSVNQWNTLSEIYRKLS